jgi:hypothetical protein
VASRAMGPLGYRERFRYHVQKTLI